MLGKSQLHPLKVRRLRAIALEAFTILSNQTPIYLSDLLTYKSNSYSFRYTNTIEIPQVRTSTYGVRSYRSTAAKIWNSLPQKFREITSAEQFRSQIGTWSGGGGGLHMLVLLKLLMLMFYIFVALMVNRQFNSSS